MLGVGGLVAFWRASRRTGLTLAALFFTLIPLLIFYLNFKYGFSMHLDQPDLPREVRERDYFFVALVRGVRPARGGRHRRADAHHRRRGPGRRRGGAGSWRARCCCSRLIPLFGNTATAIRAHETAARDFAVDLLESVEPYGILITAGDNDTFPLWYAQEVEQVRRT